MDTDYSIFLAMVFVTIFMLAIALVVPSFGTQAHTAKRMRNRINDVLADIDTGNSPLIRDKYLRHLPPWERALERLPGMEQVSLWIEQAGKGYPAYRLLFSSVFLALGGAIAVGLLSHSPALAALAALGFGLMPFLKLRYDRAKRLERFEEQLPEALDMMTRAMKAGHPFTETLNLVGEEMSDPIAREFRKTYSDINYGVNIKLSFMEMLRRVPSVSLMAVVTAILIQRESGGNMAEILTKIATVVRSRFRFQRRVRTLSAEGRLSAWILALVPFVLAGMLWITSPEYLPQLIKDPLGRQLILGAFIAISIGLIWIRRLIRIDV
jgi:tight adherence protein B